MSHTERMLFSAGRERGICLGYLARARMLQPKSEAQKQLVRLAREANRECVKYLIAARNSN